MLKFLFVYLATKQEIEIRQSDPVDPLSEEPGQVLSTTNTITDSVANVNSTGIKPKVSGDAVDEDEAEDNVDATVLDDMTKNESKWQEADVRNLAGDFIETAVGFNLRSASLCHSNHRHYSTSFT